MNPTPNDRTLNYAPPQARLSPIPIFGAVACAGGCLCGLAIAAFGIWWFVMAGLEDSLRAAAICLTGGLMVYLCARWYIKARRARFQDKLMPGQFSKG